MSFPRSGKRNSIKSGTWEKAEGEDQHLEYDDTISVRSSIAEESAIQTRSFNVLKAPSQQRTLDVSNCIPANFLSEIEAAILRSDLPISVNETEEITALGQRGVWANRVEIANWTGNLAEYEINEDPNPEVITKQIKSDLEYVQELAVRYLKPPAQPAPGEILITQEPNILPAPAPPLVIRQQPPRPATPEPLIVREAPPPPPPAVGVKRISISGKRLPPPPRKVVVERLAPVPSKPQSVITERWLPYSQTKRRVIFQAAPPDPVYCKPRNVIIQWQAPNVRVRQEVKYLGVVNANPVEYVRRYGETLRVASELPEIVRSIPVQSGYVLAADYQYNPVHELEGDVEALSLIDLEKEGLGMYKNYVTRQISNAAASIVSSTTTSATRFLASESVFNPISSDSVFRSRSEEGQNSGSEEN